MTDDSTELIAEYAHDCRIIKETDGDRVRYHYEGPFGRIKSFETEDRARLYADVQTVTGGFREEKTGERGVPPAVARAREDTLMAYLVANPTMGVEWVARFYEIDERVVRDYVSTVRDRAQDQREDQDDEAE